VFSNRIKVPKKVQEKYKLGTNDNLTFADAVKYAARESKERPNDPISANGLVDSMQTLQQEQETIREAMQAKELAKKMKQLPDEEKAQVLQGMMQEEPSPEMQGTPQMQGMPMDPSMGIPQDAPIMQAYGGRKANVFAGGDQMTFGYNNRGVNFNNLYSDRGWYKPAVEFVLDNWYEPKVQYWIENTYVPYINKYNAKRPGYKPITADYVTKERYEKYGLDGLYGGWHEGNGHLDEILDISPDGVFSGKWKSDSAVAAAAVPAAVK